MTTQKLEEKRSSGFTVTHEFKSELAAIKYVSTQTDIVESAVKEHLTTDGIFKHQYNNGIEVQYKLNP